MKRGFDLTRFCNSDATGFDMKLPETNLQAGIRGAIIDCYDDGTYEVEFSDCSGEMIALCTLSPEQSLVVWKAKERH